MSDCPQYSDLIDIFESVLCIYKQKYPILSGQIFVPNSLNTVDRAVDSCLKSGTYMVILTLHGNLCSFELWHDLSTITSPGFLNSNWMHARLFVKSYQAARHKCTIGRPGRAIIG